MSANSLNAGPPPQVAEDPISQVCGDFDIRWSSGEAPKLEEFLSSLPDSAQEEAFERLLTIDLAYRALSGETILEHEYRERFPDFSLVLQRIFRAHDLIVSAESHLRSRSSTSPWLEQVACAVDPATVYQPLEMIDRYRLIERAGRGGFGEVWKALDTELEREVAIKLARSDRQLPAGVIDQLKAEARHAASLKHAGIIPVYDIGRTSRGTYIVAEFVEGETLASLLRHGPVPHRRAVDMTIQIASALHHAHLRGLVHRDVKPGNILLRAANQDAVLTDFGLAVTEVDQLSEAQSTVGTWWYMSPEQARGESNRVDARSDIYSLGVVFYQMLTGRLPFVAASRQDYVEQLLHRPARPPRTIDDALDPGLEEICLKCLAKDVAGRYTTCADLAAALREWQKQLQQRCQPLRIEPAIPKSPAKARPFALRLFAGAMLIAVGVPTGIYIFTRGSATPPASPTGNLAVAIPGQQPNFPRANDAIDGSQQLMVQPPVIFAKSLGSIAEKPRFDSLQQTFTVLAPECRWIATAGELKTDEFVLQADISVKDWVGTGGIVWQLGVDTRQAPEKAYRCLGVEYRRNSFDRRPKLCFMEFVIKEYGFDHRHIEQLSNITSHEIELPTEEWVALACRVSPSRVLVSFGENSEWDASDPTQPRAWVPALTTACGITGSGSETRVRRLSVHAVR